LSAPDLKVGLQRFFPDEGQVDGGREGRHGRTPCCAEDALGERGHLGFLQAQAGFLICQEQIQLIAREADLQNLQESLEGQNIPQARRAGEFKAGPALGVKDFEIIDTVPDLFGQVYFNRAGKCG